ncbi:MAG: ABC transporter permease subunit [Lautropia sp.]|nr:ABC transporter permease subunit [Lautropia sp.]
MSALHRERWFPVWLVLPGSLILLVLWLLPLAILLHLALGGGLSYLDDVWRLMGRLLRDDTVREGLLAQGLRLGVAVMLEMALGLLLARQLPLHGRLAGGWCALLGVCLFAPLVVSMMGWSAVFHPAWGASWSTWGVPVMPQGGLSWWWLEGVYLLRDLWHWVPLFALLCLARLRRIERARYRAVCFDGGSSWDAFWLLEWPWLRGMLALGLALRLLVGAIIDVDFFNTVLRADSGMLAQLAQTHGWQAGVSGTVPEHAPLSWLLPALLASAEQLGDVPVLNLTACLGLLQALLVLPLMGLLLWLIGSGRRRGMVPEVQPLPVRRGGLGRPRGLLASLWRGALLLLYLGFALLPFIWLGGQALQTGSGGEGSIGFGHFMAVLDDPVWRSSLLRTMLRSLLTAAVAVLLALPMAYSFSRRLLAGDRVMVAMLMVSLMMPAVVLAFPLVHINEQLGWLGMPWAVGIAHLVYAVPLAVWVLAAGMAELPVSLDEMAMKDGFGFMRFLGQVLLPAIRHRIWAAFLACFLLGWTEFLFARVLGSMVWPPLVVLLSESLAALPADQGGAMRQQWQVLAAAAWLLLLPVMVAAWVLRHQLPDMLSLFRTPHALPRAAGRRRPQQGPVLPG